MAWKLEAADDQAQSVIVDRDMLVGRHQDADVVLQAADVSRRHAGLSLKDNALWVQDLNSSNGTFVNDVRIAVETEVKNGDSLSFASVQYTAQVAVVEVVQPIVAEEVIIEPEKEAVPEVVVEPEITKSEKVIEPAQTETQDVSEPVAPTAAQQMNTQGMPSLADRATETTLHANGMPVNVGVPKPAPIPSNVDIHARVEEAPMEIPAACVEQEQDAQKNVQVGLISIIVLVVLAIIAWLFFK
ncbi:MAG: FHA domain-containing protein [Acinetobacter sp.]